MTGTVSTDLEVLSPQNGVAVAVEVNTTLKTMIKKVRNIGNYYCSVGGAIRLEPGPKIVKDSL
jgi:hypothetical protein